MNDDEAKGLFFGGLILVILVVIGVLGSVSGLFFNRWASPYQEETRRITYGQSLTYQQGAQRDFENLCLQYAQATDDASRDIIRSTTLRRKQDYVGPPLGDDVQACFARMGV